MQLRVKRRRQEDGSSEDVSTAVSAANYFSAYGDISVHALMLRDEPRVEAYLGAMMRQKHRIEGKVVMDVGCGTGVLSMFAALHGGAARVYAIEGCAEIARLAEATILQNGLQDKVKVINAQVEKLDMSLIPEKVDVMISEWMGFYLLHESMLDSVLVARDRFLKPGGQMMPSKAIMWASIISMDHMTKWGNYYGLDMSLVGNCELAMECTKPKVDMIVDEDQLLTAPAMIRSFDINTCTLQDLQSFDCTLDFQVSRAGTAAAIAIWFDTEFAEPGQSEAVVLSTSPMFPPTHWKQTVIMFGAFGAVQVGDKASVKLAFEQSAENHRLYNITVETLA